MNKKKSWISNRKILAVVSEESSIMTHCHRKHYTKLCTLLYFYAGGGGGGGGKDIMRRRNVSSCKVGYHLAGKEGYHPTKEGIISMAKIFSGEGGINLAGMLNLEASERILTLVPS
jgi:hypothetical protein